MFCFPQNLTGFQHKRVVFNTIIKNFLCSCKIRFLNISTFIFLILLFRIYGFSLNTVEKLFYCYNGRTLKSAYFNCPNI